MAPSDPAAPQGEDRSIDRRAERSLRYVKLLHTAIWAFFVVCILAIPLLTAFAQLRLALVAAAVVGVEVLVLAANRMTCPLTDVAARYTSDRRANFDIYLPEGLAKHNKTLFGTIYLASLVALLVRWLGD